MCPQKTAKCIQYHKYQEANLGPPLWFSTPNPTPTAPLPLKTYPLFSPTSGLCPLAPGMCPTGSSTCSQWWQFLQLSIKVLQLMRPPNPHFSPNGDVHAWETFCCCLSVVSLSLSLSLSLSSVCMQRAEAGKHVKSGGRRGSFLIALMAPSPEGAPQVHHSATIG